MSWALVVTAIASGAQYMNQKSVANKQDQNIAGQLRQQADTRNKAAGRTQQLIQQQSQMTDKPQETAAAKSYNDALNANKAMAVAPLATVGNVSDAYKKAANDAKQGVSTYGAGRAANVAAMDAPIQARRDNVRNVDQYGQDLNTLWRGQRGQDFLSNMKLNGIKQNPWVNILASGAKSYAGSMGGGGGSGGGDPFSVDDSPAYGGGSGAGWWNGYGYTGNKPPAYLGGT